MYDMEQSQHAKMPPHTANCPPNTGERARTAVIEPFIRDPTGASLAPFIVCHIPPPIAPMQNAPPKSSKILQGHGSLSAIPF
jgi:hypothetical protein